MDCYTEDANGELVFVGVLDVTILYGDRVDFRNVHQTITAKITRTNALESVLLFNSQDEFQQVKEQF